MRYLIAFLLLCPVVYGDPAAKVKVLAAYTQAVAQPDLPDTLEDRPRDTQSASGDVLPDVALDRILESDPDIAGIEWWQENGVRPYTLLVFDQPNCGPCEAFRIHTLAPLVARGWHVVVLSVPHNPVYAEYYDVRVTPTTIALHNGREISRIEGNAPADKVSRLFNSVRRQPADISRAEKPYHAMPCMRFRNQWTWPGGTIPSLRRHLCEPPHNFNGAVVAAMTPNQLIAAHNAWHDSHATREPVASARRSSSRRGCPGGICPL